MKRTTVFSIIAALLIVILFISVFVILQFSPVSVKEKSDPFYVGVTYCGNNTQDAKTLIDKVKNYTNLFVLQSGTLMQNQSAITEIGAMLPILTH